jgi:predicted transcriptional regulator
VAKPKKTTTEEFLKLLEDEDGQSYADTPFTSGKKVGPNISQSKAKVEPSIEIKLSQTKAEVEPNREVDSLTNIKVEPEPKPLHEPKLSQTAAKVGPSDGSECLVGLQKNALEYLFELCVQTGSRITPAVVISTISEILKTTTAATRKAIQRLENKGYISRASYKDGRGGWSKYLLPEKVYSELLIKRSRANVEPKLSQSKAKVSTQPEPQPEPQRPNSSSNNFNKYITTIRIPENLKTIISVKEVFTLIDTDVITEQDLQESIEHFSYDLENKCVNAKTNPINLLFGLIRSGKKYKSIRLLELQNKELLEYQNRLQKLESQTNELRFAQLKIKWSEFKNSNPSFVEDIKKANKMISNENILENIAFEKFKERLVDMPD